MACQHEQLAAGFPANLLVWETTPFTPGLGDPKSGQLRYRVPDNFWQGKRSTDGRRAVLAGGASIAYTGMYAFDDVLRLRPGRFPGAARLLGRRAASWKAAGR
jgi:hypothetical protein